MAKKKDNVTKLPLPVQEEVQDPRMEMTEEEIAEFMKREEEELNFRLSKFIQHNPKPDTSSITEEDDEEEEVTIDLTNGVITQKVGEGVILPNGDAYITGDIKWDEVMVKGEVSLEDYAKKNPYTELMTDIFVRKAVAKLIKESRDSLDAIDKAVAQAPVYMRKNLWDEHERLWREKDLLNRAIRGNIVYYEEIPEWAKDYIKNYIEDVLSSLILLAERD